MSTTVFQDTFTGADTTLITARSPDIGTGYSLYSGATSPVISNANRCRTSGTGDTNRVLANTASSLPDHDYSVSIELTYMGTPGVGGSIIHLFSHDDGAGTNYEFRFNNGQLSFWDSGTLFDTPPGPFGGFTPGDAYRMTLGITDSGGTAHLLSFYFQRLSDGFYLKSDGTYQASAITCSGEGPHSIANASMHPIGKGGFQVYGYVGNAVDWHVDNFTIITVAGAAPATQFALTGPTAASVGAPTSNFTLAPDGLVASATATLNDGGQGGTFTPSTLSWTSSSANKTFTYTPASVGTKTITVTITAGTPTTVAPTHIDVVCTIKPYIEFIGDSNFELGSPSPPAAVLTALGSTWAGENRGVSGYTIADVETDLTNWTGHYNGSRTHNLVVLMIGTNGVGANGAVATYASLHTYIGHIKAAQPGWRVLVVTIPRLDSATVARAAYNASIVANAVTDGADYVIDTTGDSDLESSDTYCDGLHYTQIGKERFAAHIAAGIADYIDSLPRTASFSRARLVNAT